MIPGKMIAHYRLIEKIGEGGMGQVFVAEDTKLDRRVALKILSEPDPRPEQLARFEREAKAAASLDHPNILAIHDFGRDGSTCYLAMELLEGRTLHDKLAAGPLPLHKMLLYGLDIARAMAAAHDKDIVHRDLKPDNIFITADDRIKILDFGLAGVRGSSQAAANPPDDTTQQRLTTPGVILGTTAYMSPEQACGGDVDHRSDIFALGSILFESLTGERAFNEATTVETLASILLQDPKLELLHDAKIPPSLIQLVCRCLEKKPEQRFQSAHDLVFALQTSVDVGSGSHRDAVSRTALESPDPTPASSSRTSIAVLPFTNLSVDPEAEYFSDGMTEEVISALARLGELRVAARTSSFAFKGKDATIEEIGSKLRVQTVLEGSVRKAGKRVRITAQLVDVADGYHLWSERYERELDDIFAIYDDIATNIATKLKVALSRESLDLALNPPTQNLLAYDLYLKGRYFVEQRGEGVLRGLEFYNKAIAVDPNYALAYVGIAEALSLLFVYGAKPASELMPKAKMCAEKALQLDGGLPEAHNVMGLISIYYDWDWARAEKEFDAALAINPSDSPAHYWKGLLYFLFARRQFDEAVASTKKGLALDPMATIPAYALGLVYVGSGRYDDAIEVMHSGLERDPTSFLLYRVLGTAYSYQSEHAKAMEALEKAAALSMRNPQVLCDLGVALARSGKTEEAEKLQAEIVARSEAGYVQPTLCAVIPIVLGRMDESIAYLTRAFEEKDPNLMASLVWPTMVAAREDERFLDLVRRKMGLDLSG